MNNGISVLLLGSVAIDFDLATEAAFDAFV
jgi:hypothetical protein